MPTIMIVDDKHPRMELLKSMLPEDYHIISVSSSKEAFTHLETADEKAIDLILVNSQIPGTTDQGFFSMKPNATMHTAEPHSFIPTPLSPKSVQAFIQKELQRKS